MNRRMNLRTRKMKVAFIVAAAFVLVGYIVGTSSEPRKDTRPLAGAGSYLVKQVFDGDSLVLEGGAQVRLVGIDAPDMKDNMYYFNEARDFAKDLLEGKAIRLVQAKESSDRYGRKLAYLFLRRGESKIFVNAELVRQGCAYAWPYKPNTKHRSEIFEAQKEAQRARRGLWAHRPGKSKEYVVELRPKYSLTHRPGCSKLKNSKWPTKRFKNRIEALNYNLGAPPCRKCQP